MSLDVTSDNYTMTFIKNINGTIPLATSSAAITSSQSGLQWMTIMLLQPPDGDDEQLFVDDSFTDPRLVISHPEGIPYLLYFTGEASTTVYLTALQSVHYTNNKNVPSEGDRTVVVILYDGAVQSRTEFTSLQVTIHNFPPVITLSGGEDSYRNRYFPNRPAVSAVSPTMAAIQDDNSGNIATVTLQILNAFDAPNEILTVTYRSPERVTTPFSVSC